MEVEKRQAMISPYRTSQKEREERAKIQKSCFYMICTYPPSYERYGTYCRPASLKGPGVADVSS